MDKSLLLQSSIFSSNLLNHYKTVYPFSAIFSLFGQPNREFCFVDEKGNWRRRLHFDDAGSFYDEVLKKLPATIHIGPVYDNIQDKRNEITSRELVFDLDLPDYGADIRICCGTNKTACEICWKLATIAISILNYFLVNIFGYKKILYFYSGLKGFHCWVFDKEASRLSSDERSAIINFMAIENMAINGYIAKNILELIKREGYLKLLTEDLKLSPYIFAKEKELGSMNKAILYCLWPRFDKKVTTQLNHPIKSPFSMHTKSMKVCGLLDIKKRENPFSKENSEESLSASINRFETIVKGVAK